MIRIGTVNLKKRFVGASEVLISYLGASIIFKSITRYVSDYSTRVLADGGTVEGLTNVTTLAQNLRNSDLFERLTLLFVPSGVKASKAYVLIPDDGTGALTVVRNTTATYFNSSMILVLAAANVARYTYLTVGGNPFLLDEPQSTNLVKSSSNIQSNNWSKAQAGVTVVTSSVFSPNGVDFTELLNVNVSGGNIFTRQFIYSGTTLNTSSSVFVKKFNTRYFAIRNAGQSGLHDVFDFDTETFANRAGNNLSFESLPNGWYRILSTKTSTLANDFISFFPAVNDSGVENNSGVINVGVYVWLAQGEIASAASSPIPTAGAAVTRNADVITRTPPSGTVKIITTFSDNTTQELTTIPATYTVPEGLTKSIAMNNVL